MVKFAARTKVPVEKTKVEIERLVKRYGARGFVAGWQGDAARIEFLAHDRHIRFTVMVPEQPQAARQKWRALLRLDRRNKRPGSLPAFTLFGLAAVPCPP